MSQVLLVLLLVSSMVEASDLLQRVKNLEKKGQTWSVRIQNLQTGKIVLQHRETELLNPASLTKLVTTYAALRQISPKSHWITKIDAKANVLELVGSGDPSVVTETLTLWARDWVRQNPKPFAGICRFYDGALDQEYVNKDQLKDGERFRSYHAPVSGFNFNYNSMTHFVSPAEKVGQPVLLQPEFPHSGMELVNKAKTVSGNSDHLLWSVDELPKGRIRVQLEGKLGIDHERVTKYFKVSEPTWQAGYAFAAELERVSEKSHRCTSVEVVHEAPNLSERAVAVSGLSLSETLFRMNTYSNNMMADTLIKLIDRSADDSRPASLAGGLERAKQIIKEDFGTDVIQGIQWVSGSGLTRKNRMTVLFLSELLKKAHASNAVGPELMQSLPMPGHEGSLRRRYRPGKQKEGLGSSEVLRAKTGSLEDVRGQAGYWSAGPDAPVFSFVWIGNGPGVSHEIEEDVVEILRSAREE